MSGKIVVLAILATLCNLTVATTVSQCRDQSPLPSSVVVAGCEAEPCDLVKGTTLEANVTFTAEVTSSNLTALVKAYVLGVSIDYPLPEPDACKGLVEGACPIEAGQQYVYNLLFALLDVFPSIALTIELSLVDPDGNIATCFSLDANVI